MTMTNLDISFRNLFFFPFVFTILFLIGIVFGIFLGWALAHIIL